MKLTTLLESVYDLDTVSQRVFDELVTDHENSVSSLPMTVGGRSLYEVLKQFFNEMFSDLNRLNDWLEFGLDGDDLQLEVDAMNTDIELFMYDRRSKKLYISYFLTLFDNTAHGQFSVSDSLKFEIDPKKPKNLVLLDHIPDLYDYVNLFYYGTAVEADG